MDTPCATPPGNWTPSGSHPAAPPKLDEVLRSKLQTLRQKASENKHRLKNARIVKQPAGEESTSSTKITIQAKAKSHGSFQKPPVARTPTPPPGPPPTTISMAGATSKSKSMAKPPAASAERDNVNALAQMANLCGKAADTCKLLNSELEAKHDDQSQRAKSAGGEKQVYGKGIYTEAHEKGLMRGTR